MKPDDDYLLKLGFAHYWFQYVEWGVIYALHHATGDDVSVLATKTPRQLSNMLSDAWAGDLALEPLAERYGALVTDREHLAHSHPATYIHDGISEQRLRRHDIKYPKRPPTQIWITSEWLDTFIAAARTLNGDIP
ncbi:MAG: hypothetical protein F4Z29_01880 [Gemmatimonadetes bacterium]|nr:hypothetical protein [Gemmatimonadota bacterium]